MDQNQQTVDQEIDLLELARKLWLRRKSFYKSCGIAVLVALVVAFSIPKEYTVTVTLSPESGESSTGGEPGRQRDRRPEHHAFPGHPFIEPVRPGALRHAGAGGGW